jgi:hypothetical protein
VARQYYLESVELIQSAQRWAHGEDYAVAAVMLHDVGGKETLAFKLLHSASPSNP